MSACVNLLYFLTIYINFRQFAPKRVNTPAENPPYPPYTFSRKQESNNQTIKQSNNQTSIKKCVRATRAACVLEPTSVLVRRQPPYFAGLVKGRTDGRCFAIIVGRGRPKNWVKVARAPNLANEIKKITYFGVQLVILLAGVSDFLHRLPKP